MRRRMMLKSSAGVSPVLPAEYQQVEWIGKENTTTDNNPYLNIPIQTLVNDMISVKVKPASSLQSSREAAVVGTKESWELYYALGVITVWRNAALLSANYGSTYDTATIQLTTNNSYFTVGAYSADRYFFAGQLYHVSLERNSTIMINLIPCYRKSDGEIGMYDTVSHTFYSNVGTGAFTKGVDV